MSLLDTIRAHLEDSTLDGPSGVDLTDGYTVKFWRWFDDDLTKTDPILVIRPAGGGPSDPDLGNPDVVIQIVGQSNNRDIVAEEKRIQDIKTRMIKHPKRDDIIQFQILTDILPVVYLENDRPFFELNVRALQTRSDE